MKEPYGEGVASHTGPKSCEVDCKVDLEALIGVQTGRVLSSEITHPGCRPCRDCGKATPPAAPTRVDGGTRGVEDLCTPGNSSHGNREIPVPPDRTDGRPGRSAKVTDRKAGMHGAGKSDGGVVPQKSTNNEACVPAASTESMEGRLPVKGNATQTTTLRTQSREVVSNGLERVRKAARRNKAERFTALLHHIDVDLLRSSFEMIRSEAATGIDALTKQEYGADLDVRLEDLHERIHRGAYRALPSRRVYIPKPDGGRRPLGIAALEDKIVQGAVMTVLSSIYEQEFLGFSYGFRPEKGPQAALDALWVGIAHHKVNWVLDADIRGFFDTIDHGWMRKFLEHRIADRRLLRLIDKWLKAGVMEDGDWKETLLGTPQGAVLSPLLANVYLHYVLDLWVHQWRTRQARGEVIVVRYADDFILGFQHRTGAEQFLHALQARLAQFGLALHPDKTRLIEFGRFAEENRRRRGLGKPETFNFLGFTHMCGKTKAQGRFTIRRKTIAARLARKLKAIKQTLRRLADQPIRQMGVWLRQVLTGYFHYFAVPGNTPSLDRFRTAVARLWLRSLRRRSQRSRLTWARFAPLVECFLPRVRVLQPYPSERFYARHPRQEPYAGNLPVRICAGGAG